MGGILMSKLLVINEIGALRLRHRFASLESDLLITDPRRGSDLLIFVRPSGICMESDRQ
jgi:hypothetical protein